MIGSSSTTMNLVKRTKQLIQMRKRSRAKEGERHSGSEEKDLREAAEGVRVPEGWDDDMPEDDVPVEDDTNTINEATGEVEMDIDVEAEGSVYEFTVDYGGSEDEGMDEEPIAMEAKIPTWVGTPSVHGQKMPYVEAENVDFSSCCDENGFANRVHSAEHVFAVLQDHDQRIS